jgi:hypothetical protein
MTRPLHLVALSLGAVLLTTAAASALTGDALWRSWQDAAASVGLSLVAEGQTDDNGTLTLRGVTLGAALPGEGGMPEFALSEIVLAAQPDGVVAITTGPEMTAEVTGETSGRIVISQTGLTITAREGAGGVAYDYAAATFGIASDATYPVDMFDGSAPKEGGFDMAFTFDGLTGSYAAAEGAARSMTKVISADTFAYTIDQTDPFAGGTSRTTSTTADFAMTTTVTLPEGIDITSDDPAAWGQALRDGLALALTFSAGETSGTDTETGFMTYTVTNRAGPSTTTMEIGAAGFAVASQGESLVLSGNAPDLPVDEATLTIGPVEVAFRFPLIGPDPQDYRFLLSLADITVNEEAWALVDPGQTLPRDPAALLVDMDGQIAFDLFAMIAAEEAGEIAAPPVPQTLNIPRLAMSAAGAALEGSGQFTFDAMMQPLGQASATLRGGNALIDGLVAIGVLTEADAQGARMGLAMFWTAGEGADVLTTTLEAREDGGIYVNGQRIQ